MDTKQSSSHTLSKVALLADANSQQELIPPILLSNDVIGYGLWLNAKVILTLLTDQKCNESSETTLRKIYDFCSNEIIQLEREAKLLIQSGQ